MNSLSSATPSVAPPNPLPVIPDLLTALPLGGVEWVAVLIAALFVAAAIYLTRQRTPVTTLDDHLGETEGAQR